MENNMEMVKKEIAEITPEDVKNFFCKEATQNEVMLFLNIAKMNGLNPFKRELHLIKYGTAPATIVTGYETYLKRAERSKMWNGMKVWTEGIGENMKACCEIYRKDWEHPYYHEVYYEEYVGMKNNTDGTKSPNKFWREKPRTMLKKVVLSQAFRLAFPDEMGGLPYTVEEINSIDTDVIHSGKPDVEMPKAIEEPKQIVEPIPPAIPEVKVEVSKETPTKPDEPYTYVTPGRLKRFWALSLGSSVKKDDIERIVADLLGKTIKAYKTWSEQEYEDICKYFEGLKK